MSTLEIPIAPPAPGLRVQETTDEVLVARGRAGDTGPFEQLFHRHHVPVFRVDIRILHAQYHVLVTVNEPFIRANGIDTDYAGQGPFGSWITRITEKLAVDGLRGRRRRDRHENPWKPDYLDAPMTSPDA